MLVSACIFLSHLCTCRPVCTGWAHIQLNHIEVKCIYVFVISSPTSSYTCRLENVKYIEDKVHPLPEYRKYCMHGSHIFEVFGNL